MSCYNPIIGFPTGEITKNGKRKYEWHNAKSIGYDPRDKYFANCVTVPCGKCIGCKLDYSKKWADRMLLELQKTGKGLFVTLTYDNEHAHWTMWEDTGISILDNSLQEECCKKGWYFDGNHWCKPLYATVDKRDCQLWMKSLREYYDGIRIRFYLCSEYGPKTLRPHYHCILFGIDRGDIGDCVLVGQNELGQNYYKSEILKKIWKNGNVLVSDVSYQTMAYVARYVNKKLVEDSHYAERNVEKEFCLMSRRPGIGRSYLEDHPECINYVNINISTEKEGKKINTPDYFLRVSEKDNSEKIAALKKKKLKLARLSGKLQMRNASLSYIELLEKGEEIKKNSIKCLKDAKV